MPGRRGGAPVARTWIGIDEAGRLGADAEVVRAWWVARGEPSEPPTHRGVPSG